MVSKEDFEGSESGYIVVTLDQNAKRWRYRPVSSGPYLTDAEITALGLDAPLAIPPVIYPVQAFSQRDERWRNDPMGGVPQTIGGYGCAMVVACIVYSQRDPSIMPQSFNTTLNAHSGYNILNGAEAHLAWDRLPGIFPGLSWNGRKDWTRRLTAAELQEVFALLDVAPLILWVDYNPNTTPLNTHFVLGIGHTDTDIQIIDPIDGATTWLLLRYALPGHDLQRALWGYRHLTVTQL